MATMEERGKQVSSTSNQVLGKKEAFYSLPQKLSVTAFSGRRFRCKWPETPARLRGASGQAPEAHHTLRRGRHTGDSGHQGPEIPARPETPGFLRGASGHSPGAHHTNSFGSEKQEPETLGHLGRRLRCDRRLRTISGEDLTEKQNPIIFANELRFR